MRYGDLAMHRPGAGGAGPVLAGEDAAGYRTGSGERDEQQAHGRVPPQPASGVLDGVEQALRGLGIINDWLTAVEDLPAGVVDDDTIQGLLVGLGHIDSAVLAAVSRTIVLAEVAGCAGRDGQASPAAWVAQQLRMTGKAAARACRLAADLDHAPDILAALQAGQIARDHATTLAAAARRQRADQEAAERARRAADLEEIEERRRQAEAEAARLADEAARAERRREAAIAERAAREAAAREAARRAAEADAARAARQADLLASAKGGASPDQLSEDAEERRAKDPDALLRAEAAQRATRYLRTFKDPLNGSGRGTWSLPLDIHDTLLELLEATRTHDDPDCEPEERRSFEQRQADAFTDIINLAARTGELPTSRGQRPHVSVAVPLATLVGDSDEPGRTRFGNRLSADAARRIACDAALTRIVLNATSMALDVGRETRNWSAAQYKAAEATFGGCAFPVRDGEMCGRPMGWCDLHHITWWRHGGRTDQDNGMPACAQHHDAIHHGGWTVDYDHPGQTLTVTKTRPDGTTIRRTVNLARPTTPPPDRRSA